MAKSVGFGVRGTGANKGTGGGASKVDWDKVNEGITEGLNAARIAQIIDLGVHKDEVKLGGGEKSRTEFGTEEELDAFYEEMLEKYGKKHPALDPNKIEMGKDKSGKWYINVNEYGGEREYQEVAIVIEFPDMECDYGEGIGLKPYRALLNSTYEGNLKGFQMKKAKPKKDGGVWSFAPNSMMAKLATATGCKEILNDEDYGIDRIDLMLGKAFNVPVELTESGFVKIGTPVALMAKQDVSELPDEPMMIQFGDLSVDVLEKAKLRKAIFDKWKNATDYSDIEDIVDQYQESVKSNAASKAKAAKETESSSDDEGEEVAAPKPTKSGKVQKVVKRTAEQQEQDEEDQAVIDNW